MSCGLFSDTITRSKAVFVGILTLGTIVDDVSNEDTLIGDQEKAFHCTVNKMAAISCLIQSVYLCFVEVL